MEDGRYVEEGTGIVMWIKDGKLHRHDGPALEKPNGTKEWYLYGKLDRRDGGPAFDGTSGVKQWWQNGHLHREDGPAIEKPDGEKEYWLEGEQFSEDDYKQVMLSVRNDIEMMKDHLPEELTVDVNDLHEDQKMAVLKRIATLRAVGGNAEVENIFGEYWKKPTQH